VCPQIDRSLQRSPRPGLMLSRCKRTAAGKKLRDRRHCETCERHEPLRQIFDGSEAVVVLSLGRLIWRLHGGIRSAHFAGRLLAASRSAAVKTASFQDQFGRAGPWAWPGAPVRLRSRPVRPTRTPWVAAFERSPSPRPPAPRFSCLRADLVGGDPDLDPRNGHWRSPAQADECQSAPLFNRQARGP